MASRLLSSIRWASCLVVASGAVTDKSYSPNMANSAPFRVYVLGWLGYSSGMPSAARRGEIALRLAQRYDVPMEGACEASLACTTCHCYVEDDDFFDKLSEATEEEEDLLDKAPFLSTNSRLGCQIIISDQLSGIRLRLPRATANFYVDGHVPQPH